MEIELLIFVIDLIALALGVLSLSFPFTSLVALMISLMILVMNIGSVTGIYLTFTIITAFVSVIFFALSVLRSGDFFEWI